MRLDPVAPPSQLGLVRGLVATPAVQLGLSYLEAVQILDGNPT